MIYAKNQKNPIEDVQNIGFVTNVIIKKIDINALQRNIIHNIKKSYYKNLV